MKVLILLTATVLARSPTEVSTTAPETTTSPTTPEIKTSPTTPETTTPPTTPVTTTPANTTTTTQPTTTTTTTTTTSTATSTTTTETTTSTTTPTTTPAKTTTTTQKTTTTVAPCEVWDKKNDNSTWVVKSSKNDTLFIANTAFRVLTSYENTKHKGQCPWLFHFDPKSTNTSAQNRSIDGDWALYVTLDASDDSKNITQKANITFLEHGDKYYMQSVRVWYSENAFPHGNGSEIKEIMSDDLTNYPTPKNNSHACAYSAEIQLNVTDSLRYGFQMSPANWEAFSDFGARKKLKNPFHCPADKVIDTAETGMWNITTMPDQNGTSTVCGRLEMGAIVNINYTSILQEPMQTAFALPNNSAIDYDMSAQCHNDSIEVTFIMSELNQLFANMTLNFTSYQYNENTTKYWALTDSSITYMSGNNPFFPNSDAKLGTQTLMASNLSLFNTTYGNSYKCHNKEPGNFTNWQLTLTDVKLQPFNITDGDYGAIEDCAGDVKDDWLIPVIVGSVLGGLVIVVVVAYIIGRRKQNNDSYEHMN